MKERDLMIGDLVTYTGDDEGPITASIEGINEDSDFGVEILGTCERIEDIEPIPLTAEILEKNGFESRDNFYEITFQTNKIDNSIFRIAEFEKSGNWFFGFFDFPNLIENFRINYVHELQHALRLCGLNELADNFKI